MLALSLKTFTSSFYAVENWEFTVSNRVLKRTSVAHHKAVKRICGMGPWESNHDTCLVVEVSVSRRLYANRCASFAFAFLYSEKILSCSFVFLFEVQVVF